MALAAVFALVGSDAWAAPPRPRIISGDFFAFSPDGKYAEVNYSNSRASVAYPTEIIRMQVLRQLTAQAQSVPFVRSQVDSLSMGFEGADHTVFSVALAVSGAILLAGSHHWDCSVTVKLRVVDAPISGFTPTVVQNSPDCHIGGDIADLLHWQQQLTKMVHDQIQTALTKQIIVQFPDIDGLTTDPDIHDYLMKARVSLLGVQHYGAEFFTVQLAWPDQNLGAFLQSIPKRRRKTVSLPVTPETLAKVRAVAAQLRPHAPRRPSVRWPNYSYPSKYNPDLSDPYSDGDMSLFGGLLCLVGEEDGCQLVQRAQDPSGQPWRSPDLVGHWGTDGQFSGDQFVGVAAYLTHTHDLEYLKRLIGYLAVTERPTPDANFTLTLASYSCDYPGLSSTNCMFTGPEWSLLHAVAHQMGADAVVPASDGPEKYGAVQELLPFQAAFGDLGFPLHLVAARVLVMQKLGMDDLGMQLAAQILAQRQDRNVLFLVLSEGPSENAAQKFLTQCDRPVSDHPWQWVWERDQSGAADWGRSMVWDCLFAARLFESVR